MKNRMPRLPGLSSSLFVFGAFAVSTVGAQTAPPPATDTSRAAGTVGLEEVVVTARRREESVQRAPIAISVVSSQALTNAGITEPENLNKLVPGLAIGTGGPSTQIYLRGVGSYGTNAFADPAVQFNVDNVAYGRVTGMGGNFFDLERVEVLKGPQGTLYGRNATGGAVNLVTKKPDQEFGAGFGVDLGNYSLTKLNGFVNVPLGDAWAMRLAGQFIDRNGYQSDGTNDEDSQSGRLHLSYAPSDDLSLLLSASIVEIGGEGFAQVPVRASGYVLSDNPWTGPEFANPVALQQQAIANRQPPTLFTNGITYAKGEQDIEVTSYGAQLDWGIGAAGTLTVIANQLETDIRAVSYGPGFLYSPEDHAEQTTFEARVAGNSDSLKWVGGAFYYTEDQNFRFWVDQGFLFNQTGARIDQLDDETWAVFSELTYSLTDSLRLIGGVRYTDENKELSGQIWNRQGAPCAAIRWTPSNIGEIAASIPWAATNENGVPYPFPYCTAPSTGDENWTDTSWKVGMDFDLSPDSLLYATASRGFKAGGFFASANVSTVGNSYDPEELIAYAVGSKNTFADGRIRLNGEAFYWDYTDHQEGYLAPTNPPVPGFGFVTINVPEAEIYGIDLELTALLTDVDQVGLRMQYLHAEYTDFTFNLSRPGEFAANAPGSQPPNTVCPYTLVSIGLYELDCAGQEMPRSPEFSIQADYSHVFMLSGGATIVPGVAMQYSSDYWTAVDYNPLQRQDSFFMWDADVTYESASQTWSATAYIRNIGDEDVWQNSFVHPSGVAFNALRPPQTWGVRLNVNF